MTLFKTLVLPLAMAFTMFAADPDLNSRAKEFILAHELAVRPLEKAVNLAWWNANISGKDEDFKAKEEAQNKLDEALSDKERFAELKQIRQRQPADALLRRAIDVLYLMYLEKQVDPELLKKITAKAN